MTDKYSRLFPRDKTDEQVVSDSRLWPALMIFTEAGDLLKSLRKMRSLEDSGLEGTPTWRAYRTEAVLALEEAVALCAQLGERLGLSWREVVFKGYRRMFDKSCEVARGEF